MINNLLAEVNHFSGQNIEQCYHCHKCTAGCPIVDAMSYGPDRVLRMVSLDQKEALFSSKDIWLCAGCFTCVTRCPNDIDIAAVMDALRQLALAEGYPAGEPDALLFHRLFLGVVERLGRSHEAAMLGLFKVLSHVPLMNDVNAGIGLFMRGKVPLLPERSKARSEVKQIFERSK
jgi:heterodisulfide reductase subunit C